MIDFLFNPNGRISRKGFLVAFFAPYLVLTQILPMVIGGGMVGGLLGFVGLYYLWPSMVAVPVKRFHDIGVSGWYQAGVLLLTMLAAIMIVQGIARGGEMPDPALLTRDKLMAMITESERAQLGVSLAFLVNAAQFVFFAVAKGQDGANRFGNDPHASGQGFAD